MVVPLVIRYDTEYSPTGVLSLVVTFLPLIVNDEFEFVPFLVIVTSVKLALFDCPSKLNTFVPSLSLAKFSMFVPSPVALKATTTKSFGFVCVTSLLSSDEHDVKTICFI